MDADELTHLIHVRPYDPSVLTLIDQHWSTNIWQGEELGPLTCRRADSSIPWSSIDDRMLHRIGAIKVDWSLVTTLIEQCHVETHTFYLRVGKATITLQDVGVLLDLLINGHAVTNNDPKYKIEEWQSLYLELFGVMPPGSEFKGRYLKLKWFMGLFQSLPQDATEVLVRYYARAIILSMIDGFLLPNKSGNKVDLQYIPLLRNMDTIGKFSWSSSPLAYLYRELCRTTKPDNADIGGCLRLLQIWTWERFRCMRPNIEHDIQYVSAIVPPGPLGYKFRAGKSLENVSTHVLRVYRD